MNEQYSRTVMVLGEEGLEKLRKARVAIFGIGGVGGYTAEALARCGVGTLDLIDNDTVSLSNINRQIYALHSTVGRQKTEVAKERIADICPDTVINAYNTFFMPDNSAEFDFSQYDYVIDAVDTVTAKLEIIRCAKENGVPVISCMGAGNKLDPSRFRVTDISKTSVCPLAKVIRLELRKRGITKVKAVWSDELPQKPRAEIHDNDSAGRRAVPGSLSFVPSAAGLLAASEVVRELTGI